MAAQVHHPKQDQDLAAMRHSLAHIMATAVQQLYPQAKFGVGPVVEHGFYYDVELPEPLSAEDLAKIEAKMDEVIKADYPFEHAEWKLDEAIKYFQEHGQTYKLELLNDLKQHGTTVAKDIDRSQLGLGEDEAKVDRVSIYTDGPFTDLCRGPHVASTGKVGAFKLMRVSGAYWRGNEKNPQLQRIYGVGFTTKSELEDHLHMLAEAEKRDHRKLGRELDLFTFSDLVGSGLPLYTPRGTIIIDEIKNALKEMGHRHAMMPVSIPHLAKIDLYKISGHAEKFETELFRVVSHYGQEFVLKPVNCPHHTQIYASRQRSYRDLPLRYVEQTMQYRDEKPGQIGGLQRTRGFTVDDGHTFCRVDQIEQEASTLVKIIQEFYQNLGLWGEHWVSLSVRDPKQQDNYIGEPADWDQAEQMLAEVSRQFKLEAKIMEGEAAIYGPKLDFMFHDALGRETQLATVQLDLAMPKRFGLVYLDRDGLEKPPVIIHRAILGSFERFIMLLIEHFAGAFPVWLAPEQVRLVTVNETEELQQFGEQLRAQMQAVGLRVHLDLENESVGKKIRNAELMKVPYVVVVGEQELRGGPLKPRLRRDLGEREVSLTAEEFIRAVADEAASRTRVSTLK
jgi:threonyl-tRNA synthetase